MKEADRGEPSRGLQIGGAAHAELELFDLASPEKLSDLARRAWRLIPVTEGYVRETAFDHVDLGLAWPFYGKVDILHPEYGWIWDYKFTSALDPTPRYPHAGLPSTQEAIQKDFQLCLYAAAYRADTGFLPAGVGQAQVNYNTGEPRFVWAPPEKVEVEAALEKARYLCDEMVKVARMATRLVPTNGVPGKGPECKAYNRPCEATRFCMEIENHWSAKARRPKKLTGWEL